MTRHLSKGRVLVPGRQSFDLTSAYLHVHRLTLTPMASQATAAHVGGGVVSKPRVTFERTNSNKLHIRATCDCNCGNTQRAKRNQPREVFLYGPPTSEQRLVEGEGAPARRRRGCPGSRRGGGREVFFHFAEVSGDGLVTKFVGPPASPRQTLGRHQHCPLHRDSRTKPLSDHAARSQALGGTAASPP